MQSVLPCASTDGLQIPQVNPSANTPSRISGCAAEQVARAADRLLEAPTSLDDLIGPVREVGRHDPRVRALPCVFFLLVPAIIHLQASVGKR